MYEINELLKKFCYCPRGRYSSVHVSSEKFDKNMRMIKAKEQLKLFNDKYYTNNLALYEEMIIEYVNEYFAKININKVVDPRKDPQKVNYQDIKSKCSLKDERDIIWMKFTENGCLGVVATSNDINFDYPNSEEKYTSKKSPSRWEYNTSGIIIHSLKETWDRSFVLIFPLKNATNATNDINRHAIEKGVGNYLLSKGIPILDYYSHNY